MKKYSTPEGLPLLLFHKLFHVGSFDESDKSHQGCSQEGNGLSVSLHPEEWIRIARLGGQPTWQMSLTLGGGKFLDSHAMSTFQNGQVEQWAVQQGLLAPQERWKASWFEDDEDSAERMPVSYFSLFTNEAQAIREYGEGENDEKIEAITMLCATEKADARCGFKIGDHFVADIAKTFYAEDHGLDGVWWKDCLDVHALSAPRGVINLTRLVEWEKQCVKEVRPVPRLPRP